MADNIIYRMNIDLAGFKKGDWWVKGTEPPVVKKWVELGGGVYGTSPILTIEERDPLELGELKSEFTGVCPKCGYNSDKKEVIPELSPKKNEIKKTDDDQVFCKGVKADGSPCEFSGNRVRENGYCFMHQDQAPVDDESKKEEPKDNESPDTEPPIDETKKDKSQEDESHDEETNKSEIFTLTVNEPEEGES